MNARTSPSPEPPDPFPSSMKAALERAAHHAYTYLESLDRVAVAATVARTELVSRFDVPLTGEGVSPSVIVDELVAAVDGGLTGSAIGALPSAVATEWLMSAWDQNAANYATSPVSSVVGGRRQVVTRCAPTTAGGVVRTHHRLSDAEASPRVSSGHRRHQHHV
jgi:hypothetical protein